MRTRTPVRSRGARIRRALLLLYLVWLLATGPEHAPTERASPPRRRTRGALRPPVLAARRDDEERAARPGSRAARRR